MLRVAVRDVASARGDVQNLTQAVDDLADQSKQIGAIVDLITEISDQTNLLALNAAIEAARAGDSGRGFAVVADEVRRLAEQSRQASGDIAELIRQILRGTNETIERMAKADGSVEKVDQQIDLTGNMFVAVSKVFQDVAGQVVTIARAAEDVGAGSEEIAAATEEQSAIANVLAGDSEKLADLALRLQEQITIFRGF
ncbi:MAG: methyl-accepting chemotaxis protein [Limnochordia bacterium]|nr:methyl-accepting chemotaxis protein [Limnochordia bacterium]